MKRYKVTKCWALFLNPTYDPSANVGVLDTLSIGEEVKDEIRAAVATGHEATVSAGTITVAGWTGVGYIISDPETGAGAYRISGGANGAKLLITILVLILLAVALWYFAAWLAVLFMLAAIPALLPILIVIIIVFFTQIEKLIFFKN